jgi:hypothetical protein
MSTSVVADEPKVASEVIQDFLTGILLDGRYVATYQAPEGDLKVAFRTLTYEEETEVRKYLARTFEGQEYVDTALFRRVRDAYKLRFSIQSIHLDKKLIYDATVHDRAVLEQKVLVSEPMIAILRTLLHKFEALCNQIIKEVARGDFFGVIRESTI